MERWVADNDVITDSPIPVHGLRECFSLVKLWYNVFNEADLCGTPVLGKESKGEYLQCGAGEDF